MRYNSRLKSNNNILGIFAKYILLLFLIILFIYDFYNPKSFSPVRSFAIDFGKPLYTIVSKPFIALNSSIESITEMQNLRIENKKLKETVNYLFQEKLKLSKIMDENIKLRQISGYNKKIKLKYSIAKIIGTISSENKNIYILNLGENDNIQAKMPAISNLGLVGRILNVGSNSSQLILTTDYRSKIAVKISGKNINAIMSGNNNRHTYLEYTDKEGKIESGDLVFTSGHDNSIPSNIPVGKIFFNEGSLIPMVELFNNPENIDFVKIINLENVN